MTDIKEKVGAELSAQVARTARERLFVRRVAKALGLPASAGVQWVLSELNRRTPAACAAGEPIRLGVWMRSEADLGAVIDLVQATANAPGRGRALEVPHAAAGGDAPAVKLTPPLEALRAARARSRG